LHEISIPKRVCHRLELEWEMRRTGWGGSTGCIMHRVHTSTIYYWSCIIKILAQIMDEYYVLHFYQVKPTIKYYLV
jgi:hypothetical protein